MDKVMSPFNYTQSVTRLTIKSKSLNGIMTQLVGHDLCGFHSPVSFPHDGHDDSKLKLAGAIRR